MSTTQTEEQKQQIQIRNCIKELDSLIQFIADKGLLEEYNTCHGTKEIR